MNSYSIGKLILLFLWSVLESLRENLVALAINNALLAGILELTVALNFITAHTAQEKKGLVQCSVASERIGPFDISHLGLGTGKMYRYMDVSIYG
jgi:hypothetical protein